MLYAKTSPAEKREAFRAHHAAVGPAAHTDPGYAG